MPTGWAWRQGEWDSQVEDEFYRHWLERRPSELRSRPMDWEEQSEFPTRPVVYVSWFEATAFCRWLTDRLQSGAIGLQLWRDGRTIPWQRAGRSALQVRLPTEPKFRTFQIE